MKILHKQQNSRTAVVGYEMRSDIWMDMDIQPRMQKTAF